MNDWSSDSEKFTSLMLEKEKLKTYPLSFDPIETLEILKRIYLVLKDNHSYLPRLKPNTLKLPYKKCTLREAHSHTDKKQICFSKAFLRKRALLYYDDLNDCFVCCDGLFVLSYLLAHEVTHWQIKGAHSQRFYSAYHKLHNTLINQIISGELYRVQYETTK